MTLALRSACCATAIEPRNPILHGFIRFIRLDAYRHTADTCDPEAKAFLGPLTDNGRVATATQAVALAACSTSAEHDNYRSLLQNRAAPANVSTQGATTGGADNSSTRTQGNTWAVAFSFSALRS